MAPIELDDLEWDDDKEDANIKNHDGVSFGQTLGVFNDENAIERFDDENSEMEERHIRIGHSGSQVLVVVYTLRGMKHRLISARKATKSEKSQYVEQLR